MADKFDVAHHLTALEEGPEILVMDLNESDPKKGILKKSLQVYEGSYEIGKRIRPVTFILCNPKSKQERGIFHSQEK